MFLSRKITSGTGSAVLVVLFSLLIHPVYGQSSLESLKNYQKVTDKIHSCGAIDEADLTALAAQGVKAVINLNNEAPNFPVAHKITANALGMHYVHIPVSWTKPTLESLELFFDTMDKHQDVELLVHCQLNWRASVYIYLYRTLRQGVDETEASAPMLPIWNPKEHAPWKRFMKNAMKHFAAKEE